MATTAQDTSSRSGLTPQTLLWIAMGLVAGLLLGVWLGRAMLAPVHWETMDADLFREGEVVVFVDDAGTARFEFESSVPEWISESGSHSIGGMPECLADDADADTELVGGQPVEDVRFAWVEANLEGGSSQVVVAVDCRG